MEGGFGDGGAKGWRLAGHPVSERPGRGPRHPLVGCHVARGDHSADLLVSDEGSDRLQEALSDTSHTWRDTAAPRRGNGRPGHVTRARGGRETEGPSLTNQNGFENTWEARDADRAVVSVSTGRGVCTKDADTR